MYLSGIQGIQKEWIPDQVGDDRENGDEKKKRRNGKKRGGFPFSREWQKEMNFQSSWK